MKKLLVSLIAVICFSATALANKDASGVVVRGEGPLAQYKKMLSMEASGKLLRAINAMTGEGGYVVLDLTPDMYEFYNLSLRDNGPSDSKILGYVNNLDKNLYDYKMTLVCDIVELDGITYVTARAISPTGAEIFSVSRKGKANNFEELMEIFASVFSGVNENLLR